MSALLDRLPFAERDQVAFLEEMNRLCRHHLAGCPDYARIWPDWRPAECAEALPFLHVGLFKRLLLRTSAPGIEHGRTLQSSATTGQQASQVVLDRQSSELQSRSTRAILADFVSLSPCPLLVFDSPRALRERKVSARTAAALSLGPMASDVFFVGDSTGAGVDWAAFGRASAGHDQLMLYGLTWTLWTAWASAAVPAELKAELGRQRVLFVHSGCWKKLESLAVDRGRFDRELLDKAGPGSRVLDFYGLVEQAGVIYPLCEHGFRHVPAWAEVLVRDPYDLGSREGEAGMLQLMNTLALGAPYHSVLTEDLGRIVPGACPCGRAGKRFELLGRMPRAELRGCANV